MNARVFKIVNLAGLFELAAALDIDCIWRSDPFINRLLLGFETSHLDADNFNGLVPSGQSTTDARRGNLLQRAQLVIF